MSDILIRQVEELVTGMICSILQEVAQWLIARRIGGAFCALVSPVFGLYNGEVSRRAAT